MSSITPETVAWSTICHAIMTTYTLDSYRPRYHSINNSIWTLAGRVMEFGIGQIQVAVFLSAIEKGSRLRIATLAVEELPGLSGVDPVLLPIPDGAPQDFPIIILKNEQSGWAFQFSNSRFDLFFDPPNLPDHVELHELIHEVGGPLISLWNALEQELAARCHRLGLIVTLVAEIDNAAEEVRRRYLNPAIGIGAEEVQVHYRQKEERDDFALNRWIRLRNRPERPSKPEAYLILIDVNTQQETPLESVDASVIQRFLDTAAKAILDSTPLQAEDRR